MSEKPIVRGWSNSDHGADPATIKRSFADVAPSEAIALSLRASTGEIVEISFGVSDKTCGDLNGRNQFNRIVLTGWFTYEDVRYTAEVTWYASYSNFAIVIRSAVPIPVTIAAPIAA